MRSRVRGARFALALAAVTSAALPAVAGDVVIMPFSCSVVGGNPVLTPSDDQAHRIFGSREQRKVQTCSTVDRKRCRQWATFKFDMDCGGERVAWMQVFANASEHTRRRVWENGGRLRVADRPQRSQRVDDMCARRLGTNMEWWSVNELCEEASPLNAPTSTDMPAGFAPMVGLDASILPEDALRSRSQRLVVAKSEAKSGAANTKEADSETDEAPAAEHKSIKERAASPGDVAAPEQEATPSESAASPPAPAPMPSVAQAEPVPEADSSREAEPAPVTVLNAPADDVAQTSAAAAPADPAREMPATRDAAQGTAAAAKSDRLAESATPPADGTEPSSTPAAPADVAAGTQETVVAKTRDGPTSVATVAQAPQSAATVANEPSAIPQTTGSIGEARAAEGPGAAEAVAFVPETLTATDASSTLSLAIAAFATAALAMTALVLNWLYRSPAVMSDKAMSNTGASTVPSEVMTSATASTAFDAGALVPVTAQAHHLATTHGTSLASVSAPDRIGLGDRMPASTPEALAVLGMGVTSDGNLASLKKIIDGLRMNWHPDLARDDTDRRTRELRLKQINAAWEILGGKGAEA